MSTVPAGSVRRAMARSGPAAVIALARDARGPVIERAADSGGYDVTFAFDGRRAAPRRVGLFCPALPDGFIHLHDLGEGTFARTVRLPHGTRVGYHFCLDPPAEPTRAALVTLARSPAGRRIDRLNPVFDQIHLHGLRTRILESLLALPGAPMAPQARPRPGTGAGTIEELTVDSQALGRRKEVLVYRPAAPAADGKHPVVLLLQGNEEWQDPAFLDTMIATGIRPFIAVMPRDRRVTTRLRDFGSGAAHSRFVTDELWPALAARGTDCGPVAAVAGYSAGGLAAASLAADEPALFPRLAVISGALHLGPGTDFRRPAAAGRAQLLGRYRELPVLPQSAYLAVGWYEDAWEPAIHANTVSLAGILRRRGVRVRMDTGPTGHDTVTARAYLSSGLRWLLRDR